MVKHEKRLFVRGRKLIQVLEFLSKQQDFVNCEDIATATKIDGRRVRDLIKEIQSQGCVAVQVSHNTVGYRAKERGISSFKLKDLGLRNYIVMRTIGLSHWPTIGDAIRLGLIPGSIMPNLDNPEFQRMMKERKATFDKLVETEVWPKLQKRFGKTPK